MERSKFLVRLAKSNRQGHIREAEDSSLRLDEIIGPDTENEPFEESESEYVPSSPSCFSPATNASSVNFLSPSPLMQEFSPEIPLVPNIETKVEVSNVYTNLRNVEIHPQTNNPTISNEETAHISFVTNSKSSEDTAHTSIIANDNDDNAYKKKASARERPTICPICYQDVITHFPRHLFRHHKDNETVKQIAATKPGSKNRLTLIAALRKQGYFHLRTEKNVLNPVRTSQNLDVEYFVCVYCLGHYSKKLLYKHVKICKNRPSEVLKPGKNCLTNSQTFLASVVSKNNEFLKNSRIKKEVFSIMRPDDISLEAKNDPLICLYGESLLNKHKRAQMSVVVSNKIREVARLMIALKSVKPDTLGLFDSLKPENFQNIIAATKLISGFNEVSKTYKTASLALHMGTSLKCVCDIAIKIVIEKRSIPKITWTDRDKRKTEIKELKKLIEGHWSIEISSLALKDMREKHWEKPALLPLTNDINLLQNYVNKLADEAYENLKQNLDITRNYRTLTECVLVLTVMFNRKRVGDVQYLKIEDYHSDKNVTDQDAFVNSLTSIERLMSKKFKRVITGGKGSRPVPILFSQRVQKFITCLLQIRKGNKIVPELNPYLFANPGSENRWMSGVTIMRTFAKNCGAQNPSLLTSTKFRKHIATTLQLMTLEQNEIEQIATFMGHTKKTHEEFYRLPQDIFQTAKVAKILLMLERGKGKEFKGKRLNEIEIDNIYHSSESEREDELHNIEPLLKEIENSSNNEAATSSIKASSSCKTIKRKQKKKQFLPGIEEPDSDSEEEICVKKSKGAEKAGSKKVPVRGKWSEEEKKIVLGYFKRHIEKKIPPKKHECDELLKAHKNLIQGKSWVQIKTLVYNTYRSQ